MKLIHILKQLLLEKKADRCKRIADRKYDKPSAYKSGAIVRCRKGDIWKDLKEDESLPNISFEIKNITDNEYQILTTISGKVVGSLFFIKSKFTPVLKATSISVDPSFRRKGIGSKMYEFAEEKLKLKFIRSDNVTTPDGKALWDNPNRKFGIKDNLKEDESLHKWFKRQGTPGKQGGWVDCNAPIRKDGKITGYKPCGRKKGEDRAKYPSCRPTASKCKDPGKGKKWGKTK